jgi:rhodanese-related sulfurtransferase
MRISLLLVIALGFAVAALTACNSHEMLGAQAPGSASQSQNALPSPDEDARRISAEDAHALWAKGKAIFVDVRGDLAYNQSHIKDALSIPLMQVVPKADQLPRDKTIIFYCTCVREHTSAYGVINLRTVGMDNTAALVGGLEAWKKAGYPVEGTNETGTSN